MRAMEPRDDPPPAKRTGTAVERVLGALTGPRWWVLPLVVVAILAVVLVVVLLNQPESPAAPFSYRID